MSHFTVLVIGEDAEEQLAPYSEHIEVEAYDRTISDDSLKLFTDNAGAGLAPGSAEFLAALSEWYGELVSFNDGKYTYSSTYNPKSKWDWYQLGGRWTGYFKLKPGAAGVVGDPGVMTKAPEVGYADSARKCDIDFDGMRDDAEEHARKRWAMADALLTPEARAAYKPYLVLVKENTMEDGTVDFGAASAAYHAQEAVMQLRKAPDHQFAFEMDDVMQPLDAMVKAYRDGAVAGFAVLKDGVWSERGSMGWFATVSNEKDASDWAHEVNALIDSLPDDTLISVYDCHI